MHLWQNFRENQIIFLDVQCMSQIVENAFVSRNIEEFFESFKTLHYIRKLFIVA